MLATQERSSANATVQALRAHAALISTVGVQTKPTSRADFINEVRIDMVKAMRQEIHFVMGVCPRPDMAPLITLVHISHAVQQMVNSDLPTQILLLDAIQSSECKRMRDFAQTLPSSEGRLSDVVELLQQRIEQDCNSTAALLDVLAFSECPRVLNLRNAIASNYAREVGPTVASIRGAQQ